MLHKLQARRGETLIETMAALLVIGLASAVFLTMVLSSSRINERAAIRDGHFYEDLTQAEATTGDVPAVGSVTVGEDSVTVDVYGGEKGDLHSYRLSQKGAGG